MEDSHLCLQVGRCLLLQAGRCLLLQVGRCLLLQTGRRLPLDSLSPDLSLFYIGWSTRGIPCAKTRYYIKQSKKCNSRKKSMQPIMFSGSVIDWVSPQVIMPTKYARILKKISNMKNHWRFQLSKRILSQGVRWQGLISLDGWPHSAICTPCSMFYSTLYKNWVL